jgi:ribosomal protein S18 acetylase RimI-like enzyme
MRIRTLHAGDVATAQRIVRRFHARSLPCAYLASVLANDANVLLVAEDGGDLVGFLFAHWIDRLYVQREQLFIYEVEVVADHRRTGVGSGLLSTALAFARERQTRTFVFTNQSNTAAVALYRKAGGIAENGDDLLFVFS